MVLTYLSVILKNGSDRPPGKGSTQEVQSLKADGRATFWLYKRSSLKVADMAHVESSVFELLGHLPGYRTLDIHEFYGCWLENAQITGSGSPRPSFEATLDAKGNISAPGCSGPRKPATSRPRPRAEDFCWGPVDSEPDVGRW